MPLNKSRRSAEFRANKRLWWTLFQDLFTQVKKIAKFLGKDNSDEFYQQIVDACQIDKMRSKKQEAVPDDVKAYFAEGYNPFYRKGQYEYNMYMKETDFHFQFTVNKILGLIFDKWFWIRKNLKWVWKRINCPRLDKDGFTTIILIEYL